MATQFQNYANLVASTLLADQVGSVPGIPNPLATSSLDTAILLDPVQIEAYKQSVADQMNAQSGGSKFTDLSQRIQDLIITTTAQGADTLEVHLTDPTLLLLVSGFIQADVSGYLWPPIDVNFPSDTDCVWRLCQVRFTNELTDANLILTFEDRIVSLLRQRGPANGGIRQGQPNQTLGGFIKELVDDTNYALKPVPKIRLLELIDPQDPNYTVPITQTPASSVITKQGKQPIRKNPNRDKQGLTSAQQTALDQIQQSVQQFFANHPSTTFQEAEPYAGQLANTPAAQSGNADFVPNASYIPGLGDLNP